MRPLILIALTAATALAATMYARHSRARRLVAELEAVLLRAERDEAREALAVAVAEGTALTEMRARGIDIVGIVRTGTRDHRRSN